MRFVFGDDFIFFVGTFIFLCCPALYLDTRKSMLDQFFWERSDAVFCDFYLIFNHIVDLVHAILIVGQYVIKILYVKSGILEQRQSFLFFAIFYLHVVNEGCNGLKNRVT